MKRRRASLVFVCSLLVSLHRPRPIQRTPKEAPMTIHASWTIRCKGHSRRRQIRRTTPRVACPSTSTITEISRPPERAPCSPPAPRSKVLALTSPLNRSQARSKGLTGTFVLQHSGTMEQGVRPSHHHGRPRLRYRRAQRALRKNDHQHRAEGKHSYDFEYSLPNAN